MLEKDPEFYSFYKKFLITFFLSLILSPPYFSIIIPIYIYYFDNTPHKYRKSALCKLRLISISKFIIQIINNFPLKLHGFALNLGSFL
jgi:hypothetical protein